VRELARERGVHPQTIRRWLKRLDQKTNGQTIWRDSDAPNAPIRTTLRALRDADPRLVQARELERDLWASEVRATIANSIRSIVRASVREIGADLTNRVERLEKGHSKQLELFKLVLPMQQSATQ